MLPVCGEQAGLGLMRWYRWSTGWLHLVAAAFGLECSLAFAWKCAMHRKHMSTAEKTTNMKDPTVIGSSSSAGMSIENYDQ